MLRGLFGLAAAPVAAKAAEASNAIKDVPAEAPKVLALADDGYDTGIWCTVAAFSVCPYSVDAIRVDVDEDDYEYMYRARSDDDA